MPKNHLKSNSKPKVAVVSLTCCEGCQFALLDLHERFLELQDKVDFTEFRLISEHNVEVGHEHWSCSLLPQTSCQFDLAFVEGSPVTQDNIKTLEEIRKKSKFLVALGCCAHLGCVQKIKNYLDKEEVLRLVYQKTKGIDNPLIKPLSDYVKVDFILPACPINAEEFLLSVYSFLLGRSLEIAQRPVCYECQNNGYECLLEKGQICFGPMTLGGCQAVCLASSQPCWACRGLVEDAKIQNMIKCLEKILPADKFIKILEIFGARDEWEREMKQTK